MVGCKCAFSIKSRQQTCQLHNCGSLKTFTGEVVRKTTKIEDCLTTRLNSKITPHSGYFLNQTVFGYISIRQERNYKHELLFRDVLFSPESHNTRLNTLLVHTLLS